MKKFNNRSRTRIKEYKEKEKTLMKVHILFMKVEN